MSGTTGTVNANAGNLSVNVLTIREGINVTDTTITKRTTLTERLTISGNAEFNVNTLIANIVSSEDIDRFAYASTGIDVPVNIDPVGISEAWDVTTVQICGCPGSGALQTVNPTTGVITYTPNAGFVGVDVFHYTIVDNHGILTKVFQYVAVFSSSIPPFINNHTFVNNIDFTPPYDYSYDITPYVVINSNPIDYSTLVIETIWDPQGQWPFIGLQGPLVLPNINVPVIVTHDNNGTIILTVTGIPEMPRIASGFLLKVKVSDTLGNESNIGNFNLFYVY